MSWRRGQTAILTQVLPRPLQHFFRVLAWVAKGPNPSVSSWSSFWHPVSNWIEPSGHLIIIVFNVPLLPLFFRLLTQVHLLIDGSVEGQYITLLYDLSEEYSQHHMAKPVFDTEVLTLASLPSIKTILEYYSLEYNSISSSLRVEHPILSHYATESPSLEFSYWSIRLNAVVCSMPFPNFPVCQLRQFSTFLAESDQVAQVYCIVDKNKLKKIKKSHQRNY